MKEIRTDGENSLQTASYVTFMFRCQPSFEHLPLPLPVNVRTRTDQMSHAQYCKTSTIVYRKNYMPVTATDPIKIILAIIFPPLGVFFEVGLTGHFWLNVLLTLCGFIPGIIHALYVILKH